MKGASDGYAKLQDPPQMVGVKILARHCLRSSISQYSLAQFK